LVPVEETRGLKLPLTRDERTLVEVAERFAKDTIAPIAERLEQEKSPLSASVIAEWVRCGLNGMQVSPSGEVREQASLQGRRGRSDRALVLSMRIRTDQYARLGHADRARRNGGTG
jgi:hypothetical protein